MQGSKLGSLVLRYFYSSLGGSGAWTLNNSYCEGDTANTDSEVESGSKEKQGRGGHTARYRHLAHFGILFVRNNCTTFSLISIGLKLY